MVVIGCLWMASRGLSAEELKEPELTTQLSNWKLTGILSGSLNVTQFHEWQDGGTDMVALTGRGEIWAIRASGRHVWKNWLRAEYGVSKTNGADYRSSADLLKLDSRFEQTLHARLNAYVRGYADSHMSNQYDYFDDPSSVLIDGYPYAQQTDKFKIAGGFDPIRLEEGVGIGLMVYKNKNESSKITVMTGVGGRQTFAGDFYRKDDDEDTPGIEYITVDNDSEFGIELVLDTLLTVNEHVKFTSFAVLFLGLDDELWRARWDNSLEITLGKYIGVSLTADLVYDESIYDGTQYKTGTLITLSYRVF